MDGPSARPHAVGGQFTHPDRLHEKRAFISILVESGFRQVNVDRYEASRRRVFKRALFWLLGAGCAWVVVESARAQSMF